MMGFVLGMMVRGMVKWAGSALMRCGVALHCIAMLKGRDAFPEKTVVQEY
jgi:hypothetical protein